MLCFFFQAEDGIRDGHVTGVQTCALPIYVGGGLILEHEALEQSGGNDDHRVPDIVGIERLDGSGGLDDPHRRAVALLATTAVAGGVLVEDRAAGGEQPGSGRPAPEDRPPAGRCAPALITLRREWSIRGHCHHLPDPGFLAHSLQSVSIASLTHPATDVNRFGRRLVRCHHSPKSRSALRCMISCRSCASRPAARKAPTARAGSIRVESEPNRSRSGPTWSSTQRIRSASGCEYPGSSQSRSVRRAASGAKLGREG